MRLEQRLNSLWYRRSLPPGYWLAWPLEVLFRALASLRSRLYRHGFKRVWQAPVPVIVIGNIHVGGTGKTPLVIALAQWLQTQGWRPGIVSRGYGGADNGRAQLVTAESNPAAVGDEALLVHQQSGVPVAIGRQRVAAAKALLAATDCNLVISDDGLQHWALGRDIELVVMDAQRGPGNGHCLPLGPLREPLTRLEAMDLVILSGADDSLESPGYHLQPQCFRHLHDGTQRELDEWPQGQRVHALAGIGDPARFFASLRTLGLDPVTHAFPDHHPYRPQDLQFDEPLPVVMTAKDAVKCTAFAPADSWVLEVAASVPEALKALLSTRLPAKEIA